jgi:putative DNA methylase
VLREMPLGLPGVVHQRDAVSDGIERAIFSTDPPYYDNVPYADLSDFFYVWLRRVLIDVWPDQFRTIAVPKADELVANPVRHGGREAGERFFLTRMRAALRRCASAQEPEYPTTIYYAFKQTEDDDGGTASTGWEAFLEAALQADYLIDGTWPVRSERAGRMRDLDSNALASSIVLVCRKRPDDAPSATRGEFRRMLRKELPDALKKLQQGNIAPVDVAQASIGPGMAIFSRHKQVLEANGASMTVRAALQLINEVLDEYLASGEGDFDADTRFATTWYEQHGWEPGPFGEAETLAKARNVSVKGVELAGICRSAAGKVRILKRHEMRPLDYDPAADATPTVWEFTQHMIRYLDDEGEEAAARLLKKLGSSADVTRELAYRLYNTCERKKWAEDARSYNGLILAWPELEKLAAKIVDETPAATPSKPGKKGKGKAPAKGGQQALFDGDEE